MAKCVKLPAKLNAVTTQTAVSSCFNSNCEQSPRLRCHPSLATGAQTEVECTSSAEYKQCRLHVLYTACEVCTPGTLLGLQWTCSVHCHTLQVHSTSVWVPTDDRDCAQSVCHKYIAVKQLLVFCIFIFLQIMPWTHSQILFYKRSF